MSCPTISTGNDLLCPVNTCSHLEQLVFFAKPLFIFSELMTIAYVELTLIELCLFGSYMKLA